MKKIILILGLVLLAPNTVIAQSNDTSKSTTITYTVNPSYTIEIPANVSVGSKLNVGLQNVVVDSNKQVVVKLDNQDFKLSCGNHSISYKVKNSNNELSAGGTILIVKPGETPSGSISLDFEVIGNAKYAGDYTGTLNFLISVESS